MNASDKQAVAEAKRRQQAYGTKTQQTGGEVGQTIHNQFSGIGGGIEDKLVDLIGAEILQRVFSRLSNGDFGSLASQMFENFNKGIHSSIDLEIQALKEWDESPKYALPSSAESDG